MSDRSLTTMTPRNVEDFDIWVFEASDLLASVVPIQAPWAAAVENYQLDEPADWDVHRVPHRWKHLSQSAIRRISLNPGPILQQCTTSKAMAQKGTIIVTGSSRRARSESELELNPPRNRLRPRSPRRHWTASAHSKASSARSLTRELKQPRVVKQTTAKPLLDQHVPSRGL